MAKIPAGILGRLSGKVGEVVGASWKGIAYIRQYVIPANPNTALQQTERGLFADMVWLAKACLGPILQVFWDPFIRQNSGWAHFIGTNRKLYTESGDYSSVLMASGTLEGTVVLGALYQSDSVAVSWSGTVLGNGDPGDAALVFIYDKANKVGFFNGTEVRSDQVAVVVVGSDRTASDLQCWLFFADSASAPTSVSYSDWHQVTTG
jgi:hypothetical protein